MERVDDHAREPKRLATTFRHESLRQFAKGVPVFLRGPGSDLQGALGVGIVRGQEDAALGFHRQHAIARFEPETIGHVLRQRRAHRPARLAQRYLFGHAAQSSILVLQSPTAGMNDTAPAARTHDDRLGRLRTAGLIALVAGAMGSLVLLFRARQNPPPFLLALFVLWVLGPFATLWLAYLWSARWSAGTRRTLYLTMLAVSIGSLVVYRADLRPAGAAAAFVWVMVPPASLLLAACAVAAAAWISRGRSR